jgi:hypothetical protein
LAQPGAETDGRNGHGGADYGLGDEDGNIDVAINVS